MNVFCFDSLSDAERVSPEYGVPGLDPEAFAAVVSLWEHDGQGASAQAAGERLDRSLVDYLAEACGLAMQQAGVEGWIGTLTSFPGQTAAVAEAWLGDVVAAGEGRLFWRALPRCPSVEWNRIWSAPLNPLHTNVVMVGSPSTEPPPEKAVFPFTAPAVSTLLPWPWLPEQVPTGWLTRHADRLHFLVLGVNDCEVGVQLVAKREDGEWLRGICKEQDRLAG